MVLSAAGAPAYAGSFEDGLAAAKAGNAAEARRFWSPLAEQGTASEQFRIGQMYFSGPISEAENLPVDRTEALKWFLLAAKKDVRDAQVYLGGMYHRGQGTARDDVRAYLWLSIAASRGDYAAERNLDIVAMSLTDADLGRARAMAARCQASRYRDCD